MILIVSVYETTRAHSADKQAAPWISFTHLCMVRKLNIRTLVARVISSRRINTVGKAVQSVTRRTYHKFSIRQIIFYCSPQHILKLILP